MFLLACEQILINACFPLHFLVAHDEIEALDALEADDD